MTRLFGTVVIVSALVVILAMPFIEIASLFETGFSIDTALVSAKNYATIIAAQDSNLEDTGAVINKQVFEQRFKESVCGELNLHISDGSPKLGNNKYSRVKITFKEVLNQPDMYKVIAETEYIYKTAPFIRLYKAGLIGRPEVNRETVCELKVRW